MHGSFEKGNIAFFLNGRLNACYNCVDRHVLELDRGDDVAVVWEGEEPGNRPPPSKRNPRKRVAESGSRRTTKTR